MTEFEVDLESSVHARVGTVLVSKYRLERVIGIGGMAAVYAATHRNQAEFAVKVLHNDLSARDDVRSRFLREGYIANSVKHSGAVRVVDDDVAEDGAAFLVMELLHGASVEDLWFHAERRLPLRVALAVGDQLLDVLAAAHAKSIVHRDIKPANLFVSSNGDLKVLDFGIARLRDAAVNTLHATTQQGTMLGTPAFMSPEQARGRTNEVDGQTDVWAVGATLFALITGQLVHEADTAPMLLVRAASSNARKLASVLPDAPPAVAALIDRALAFDKTSRWPGAAAMRDALREAFQATFGESVTREVLAACYSDYDSAPPTLPAPENAAAGEGTAPSPADAAPEPAPPASPATSSMVKTKVEGGAPQLQATVPLGARAPVVPAAAPPAAPRVAAPASGLTTSQPVSTETPASSREPRAAPKRSPMLLAVGVALVLGLVIGIAAILIERAHTAARQAAPPVATTLAAPPPAATVLPSASQAPSPPASSPSAPSPP
jgi:serine/threonine-protein kinase